MKVYEFKGFPNPARIRVALAEKGLFDQVEFVHVDVPAGEHKSPAFSAINSSGTVPVLELGDGTKISECSAITEYLDHAAGSAELTGQTGKERAVIAMGGFAYAEFAGLDIPENCAHLLAWRERVAARPSAALAA